MKVRKNHTVRNLSGSTFDSFLEQEEIREEVEAVAIKRVLAWQLSRLTIRVADVKTKRT